MQNRPLTTRVLGALALGLAVHAGPAAAIDWSPIALGSLIRASDAVLIGTVKTVADGAWPGATVASIQVEQVLAGAASPVVVLERTGDVTDEALLDAGERALLFVRRDQGTQASFAVVDPRGVVPIHGQAALAATLAVMKQALAARFVLDEYRPLLAAGSEPPPSRLLAWLLEELAAHLTKDDAPALAKLVCDGDQGALPAVHAWAIGRAGARRISDARVCLEALAADGKAGAPRLRAIAALGDLRDGRSSSTLRPLIELAPKPADDGRARPPDHVMAAVLALGKIGDPAAVNDLVRLTDRTDDLAVHSAVVHALGLIGGPTVRGPLRRISNTDPSPAVRHQAARTLRRLEATTEKHP